MSQIAIEVSKVAQYVENEQSKIIRIGTYSMMSELLTHSLQLTNKEFNAIFTFR